MKKYTVGGYCMGRLLLHATHDPRFPCRCMRWLLTVTGEYLMGYEEIFLLLEAIFLLHYEFVPAIFSRDVLVRHRQTKRLRK